MTDKISDLAAWVADYSHGAPEAIDMQLWAHGKCGSCCMVLCWPIKWRLVNLLTFITGMPLMVV